MATTSKGIYYPTVDTIITPLANQFATLAQSVDDALGNIVSAGHYTGTNAQRVALTAPTLRKGITWYTSDTNLMYLYNGSSWVLWQRSAAPYAWAAGSSNVTASFPTISFPSGRFTRPPIVVAQIISGAGADVGVTVMVTDITTTNFKARHSAGSGTKNIHWQAVQMQESGAAG